MPIIRAFPIPITDGGSGQVSQTAAFDALSPLTTRGDLLTRDTSNNVRLAKGTNGQYLKIGANDPVWAAAPAFSCQFACGDSTGFNPVASHTYYWGTLFGVDPGETDGPPPFFVPRACTLVAVYASMNPVGTHTDAANCSLYVRKNTSTDIVTVSTTIQLTTQPVNVNQTGLSVALSAGDQLYMKFVAGAWTTAPTAVFANAVLYFEVP